MALTYIFFAYQGTYIYIFFAYQGVQTRSKAVLRQR